MSDEEQDYAAWRAERHRRAQAHAFGWAGRASIEYGQAIRHEDDARARQNHDSAWQRDRIAEDRRQAQFHGVRSTEALKLAEMWAHVARALADVDRPAPLPVDAGTLDVDQGEQHDHRTELAHTHPE